MSSIKRKTIKNKEIRLNAIDKMKYERDIKIENDKKQKQILNSIECYYNTQIELLREELERERIEMSHNMFA